MHVALVLGTRPEATKLAPVILALREQAGVEATVISTGQHRELLPQTLAVFGLRADVDLAVMAARQTLTQITTRVLDGCARVFAELRPDVVLVHGDTTTTLAGALAAFYAGLPVGHVEAGLRTGDRWSPFPEEMNRLLADRLATVHFAPTALAAANLRREGVAAASVFVTGNTGIDAVRMVAGPRRRRPAGSTRLVLVEAHRHENLGEPMARIAQGVVALVRARGDVEVEWSLHPNPAVQQPVRRVAGGEDRISLIDPPAFDVWARRMAEADVLLTDSGGMQEESTAIGLPVLVLRGETERPEVIASGAGRLVGTESARIASETARLLDDPAAYARMAEAGCAVGDGQAARRTVEALLYHMGHAAQAPEAFASAVVD